MKNRHIVSLFAFLGALALASDAFAFATSTTRWTPNRTVTMHLSLGDPTPLSDGFASFDQSAADALNIWNTYLVHLRFASVIASPLPPADSDYDNSVLFSSSIFGEAFGSNTLAVTLISSRSNVRVETDVLVNDAYTWDSYRGPTRPDVYDFHRVILHEFGHVLGLEHPDEDRQTVTALMNSRSSNIDAVQTDDIAGARSLHDTGPAYLSGNPAPTLINLSTRALVGVGNNVLIGGFIIQGSQPATVILRAIGHSLAARGINAPLRDPVMELRGPSGVLVTENDDWVNGSDAATIASYRLDPSNSLESALLRTLAPGSYTVVIRAYDGGDGNLIGTGLVELYDLHTSSGRPGNIATRGQIASANDPMIGGFIIGPGSPKEIVVRGLGPSLARSGIANALANPTLQLVDASGNTLRTNDNWQTDPASARVQAVGLAPTEPVESALDTTLSPGSYTAVLRGLNGGTGVGLVEVYDLSPAP